MMAFLPSTHPLFCCRFADWQVLDDDFEYVQPTGGMLNRQGLLDWLISLVGCQGCVAPVPHVITRQPARQDCPSQAMRVGQCRWVPPVSQLARTRRARRCQ